MKALNNRMLSLICLISANLTMGQTRSLISEKIYLSGSFNNHLIEIPDQIGSKSVNFLKQISIDKDTLQILSYSNYKEGAKAITIFHNGVLTDTINVEFISSRVFYAANRVYLVGHNGHNIRERETIVIKTNPFNGKVLDYKTFNGFEFEYVCNDLIYGFIEVSDEPDSLDILFSVNPINWQLNPVSSISKQVGMREKDNIVRSYAYGGCKNAIIRTGSRYSDVIANEKYFQLNLLSKELIDVTPLMRKVFDFYDLYLRLDESSFYDGYIYAGGYFDQEYEGKFKEPPFLINTEIDNPYQLISYGTHYTGHNYVGGRLESLNIKTKLDNDVDVLIAHKYSLSFDRSLKIIFDNLELNQNSLSLLSIYELNLLKNFIFAKHNYQFDTLYYQAFFNLFEFYSRQKENRVKEINHLLTESDKSNLKLINKALED